MANTIVFGRFYHGRQAESGSPQQGGVSYFLVKKLPYQRAVSENRAGVFRTYGTVPTSAMQSIQWKVPSHPAVGATTLAGSVSRFDELPGDMPLFVGNGHAPYKLFWELWYQEYEAIEGCMPGPNDNGNYNCGGGTMVRPTPTGITT